MWSITVDVHATPSTEWNDITLRRLRVVISLIVHRRYILEIIVATHYAAAVKNNVRRRGRLSSKQRACTRWLIGSLA